VHAATQEPVVEALAGGRPEYVAMEDGKGRSINTTMVAVRVVGWSVGWSVGLAQRIEGHVHRLID